MSNQLPQAMEVELAGCLFKAVSAKLGNDSTEALFAGTLLSIVAQNAAKAAFNYGYAIREKENN